MLPFVIHDLAEFTSGKVGCSAKDFFNCQMLIVTDRQTVRQKHTARAAVYSVEGAAFYETII